MRATENLHRAELTALERAEHVAEWVGLTDVQSAQVAPIESKRADGRGHRQEGGINAAVRELGIDRTEAQRAANGLGTWEPAGCIVASQRVVPAPPLAVNGVGNLGTDRPTDGG